MGASSSATAGEPAEAFLNQMRSAGYYDFAIIYLDRLPKMAGVDKSILEAIPLEKAQVHIDAAIGARTTKERDDAFQEAEKQLQLFSKNESHPRQPEAKSQLGKLQMVRAAQFLSGDPTDTDRASAREAYLAAAKTFDSIIETLRGKLESMQGARIDAAKEPEKAALRDQYRFEFLQAQYNSGEAKLQASQTYPDPAASGKALLEESLGRFTDLSEKYGDYIQGAQSFYSRGKVEQLLGLREQAIDSFTRMTETQDVDLLREAKFGATAGLVQLWLVGRKPDYNASIAIAQPMVDSIRPNERAMPSPQLLKLELANAYLAKSKDEANNNAPERKRASGAARKLLSEASKVPGPHLKATKERLASLGIEDKSDRIELPTADDPKGLDDALTSVRTLMQTISLQEGQIDEIEKIRGKKSDQEIAELESLTRSRDDARTVAMTLLRRGLSMINGETQNAQINQGRQFLAYLLFQDKQFYEANVVGQFLARYAPKTDPGLRGGLIALSSLQQLIAAEKDRASAGLTDALENLGDYLVQTWPDDPQANAAQGTIIRLAIGNDDLEKAESLIAKVSDGPEKASFQRLMGQLLWNRSVVLRGQDSKAEADKALRDASTYLQTGLKGISKGLVAPEAMQAALVLAKVHLIQDDADAALATLDDPTYGPIPLAGKMDPPSDSFLPDLYRTELQAVVGKMTTAGGKPDAMLKRASAAIDKLRASATGEEGEKRMVATFLSLARDIRDQIETASPDRKVKLTDAFTVFLKNVSSTTKDPATLQLVAQTLMEFGESMMPVGVGKAEGQAADLLKGASESFAQLQASDAESPTIAYLYGKCLRMLGNYSDALNQFTNVLKKNPMMLDAQKEAALTYEQWASELKPDFAAKSYRAALSGSRPGPDRKNIIWGWGRIGQLTMRDPKFREIFFDARYHVALCRYLQGQVAKDQKLIEQSAIDITSVAALYPDMGGPQQRRKFDALLKQIQKAAGQDVIGLPPLPAQAANR